MLGVENAMHDVIARMDSDDISVPDRFEKQLAYLESHPECDIVGGQITEFIDSPDNIVGKREVPCSNEAIYQYMRSRCALNHPTVMFRKKAVLDAGNYQDWFWIYVDSYDGTRLCVCQSARCTCQYAFWT